LRGLLHELVAAGLITAIRRRLPLRRTVATVLAATALAYGLAGCGGSSTSGGDTTRCTKPPAGVGPDADATLQDKNAGGTYCLGKGDVLTVFLHAPTGEERFGPVTATPKGVLEARSTGVMTLPLGVSAGVFAATGTGTVTLRSVRPPCDPPATNGCDAAHAWTARMVVR
jgi:hypothetical protein